MSRRHLTSRSRGKGGGRANKGSKYDGLHGWIDQQYDDVRLLRLLIAAANNPQAKSSSSQHDVTRFVRRSHDLATST